MNSKGEVSKWGNVIRGSRRWKSHKSSLGTISSDGAAGCLQVSQSRDDSARLIPRLRL